MSGEDIAAEVSAALAEAGAATSGDGQPFLVLLMPRKPALGGGQRTPWNMGDVESPNPVGIELLAIGSESITRDENGLLLKHKTIKLTVEAKRGVVPIKSDRIQIGDKILEVDTVAATSPGGFALLYDLVLTEQ